MKNFNLYIEQFDYTPIRELFRTKEQLRILKKREYLVHQNEATQIVALIECGIFRYICTSDDGNEHIIGYSFQGEFVCDYPSLILGSRTTVSIQAMVDCEVYWLPIHVLNQFWETNMDTQRMGRHAAEILFTEMYQRLLGFYCDTPEQRYIKLMRRCPDLKEKIPLKDIASFLRVTPETVSNIRRKFRYK